MKGLVLNSGGIDSPVATYVMGEHDLLTVHFDSSPYAVHTAEIAEKTVERLNEVLGKDISMITIHHGNTLSEFLKKCGKDNIKYTCIFCKRMMLKTAERIAHMNQCDFLVTGENLGQVASQTLQNIYVTSRAVSIPVVRPLIGLDKLDIITIAENIDTYTISTEKAVPCKAVPQYPAIRAHLARVEAVEERFDIEGLIKKALQTVTQ